MLTHAVVGALVGAVAFAVTPSVAGQGPPHALPDAVAALEGVGNRAVHCRGTDIYGGMED